MSCVVAMLSLVARLLIRWSIFSVVPRGRPVRFESLRPLDSFHLLSQYCTVLFAQFIAFATAFTSSFGPIG